MTTKLALVSRMKNPFVFPLLAKAQGKKGFLKGIL